VKQAHRRANVFGDTDDQIAWDGPLAVVVNRLSASASEIFAGAIQDYGRGIIIGSQTFGKGTVQTLIPLNRGQLKITQAKFYRISGQSTQHQGVIPDIALPEIYDTDRIGESSLEDALPWDVIEPVTYVHSNTIPDALPTLRTQHDERVATDPDFKYLEALADRSRAERAQTTESLNEATRRKEKADEDAWRLGIENQLRRAKGQPALTSIDQLDAAQDDDDGAADEGPPNTPQDDAMLTESGHIVLDFINLTHQVASNGPGKARTAVQ
jgi:carboxyl-terminal processing protease